MLHIRNKLKNFYGDRKIVVFDIGAYNFEDSVAYKNLFNSEIYAFEASKKNYDLYLSYAISHGIKAYNLALSDINGKSKFYNSSKLNDGGIEIEWGPSGSLLEPSKSLKDRITFELPEEVECKTIEEFCLLNNIKNVDYIHIDVQGMEHRVLSGLGKIRPDYILAETCEYNSYNGSGSIEDLDEYLYSIGYSIEERMEYDTLYNRIK